MKPKERRDRLFKTSRPNIRKIELFGEDGFGRDMGVLWGAYKMGSFRDMPEMTQEQFAEYWVNVAAEYQKRWMIEDVNTKFSEGRGPIGVMMAVYNGWELEPHFEPFAWATPKNILKGVVGFLQMMRYDKDVGIVNVYSLKDTKRFFKHVTNYGVLRYATEIPNGDIRGDRYIFYVRGRKDDQHRRLATG